jgi:cytosine/adenosine deaminase-related metal-dependent hydrolase
VGSIEPGKRADLVILHPSPRATPILPAGVASYIVYGLTAHHVETVFVNGNPVVEDHRVTTIDSQTIEKTLDRVVPRLWAKLGIDVPSS